MEQKKNTSKTFRKGVVFLLIFLNLFLTITPFIGACPVNDLIENNSGFPLQNPNADHEDNLPLKSTTDEISAWNFVKRTRQSFPGINQNFLLPAKIFFLSRPATIQVREGFPNLIRPDYYLFLSLYNLF